jgi:hypothetical protein
MSKGVTFKDNLGPVNISNENRVARSSILGKLVEIIATSNTESCNLSRDPAEIEIKINFNDLVTHRWLVDEYVDNSVLIDSSITQLNQLINNGSTKLKRQMKLFYRNALSDFRVNSKPFDLNKLKAQSDNIVERVMSLSSEFVRASSDLQVGYYDEDINFGIALITSYSIIECIVLENPNDHN